MNRIGSRIKSVRNMEKLWMTARRLSDQAAFSLLFNIIDVEIFNAIFLDVRDASRIHRKQVHVTTHVEPFDEF